MNNPRGNWIQIDRGIYRFREYLDLPSHDTDHFVRWSLWSRGRAVVSHASALAVHDLGIANPAEIHLTVPPAFRQKNNAVVLHRGELADQDRLKLESEDTGGDLGRLRAE